MNMFNLFKRKKSNKLLNETISVMQGSLKKSFENIKKDFSMIDFHHKDFHKKHETHKINHEAHKKNIVLLSERLTAIENSLGLLKELEIVDEEVNDKQTINFGVLDEMTEVSQKICYILAALQQENKDMVTLKTLAEEMYPDKEYAKIRSTISQYTTELEELGYVQKKKKGKQVYIKSTEKNPFLKEKSKLKKSKKKIEIKGEIKNGT
jgi:hypothetical protein